MKATSTWANRRKRVQCWQEAVKVERSAMQNLKAVKAATSTASDLFETALTPVFLESREHALTHTI